MDRPVPGQPVALAPDLRLVLAPNPSAMTYWGTNTYLLGTDDITVIDPGPDDPAHLRALLAALAPGQRIGTILVTHAHRDHSALAPALAHETGAKVLGFGPPQAGRSITMQQLADHDPQDGEGTDHAFRPDATLADGDQIGALRVLHTPGHFAGHLCFALGDTLFSGDHVMGWSTSLIAPPDGDMAAYLASLHRLAVQPFVCAYPGHGAPIALPAQHMRNLIAHRHRREALIIAALQQGSCDLPTLTARAYPDIAPDLIPAARRNTFAHLIDLAERKQITATPSLASTALFART